MCIYYSVRFYYFYYLFLFVHLFFFFYFVSILQTNWEFRAENTKFKISKILLLISIIEILQFLLLLSIIRFFSFFKERSFLLPLFVLFIDVPLLQLKFRKIKSYFWKLEIWKTPNNFFSSFIIFCIAFHQNGLFFFIIIFLCRIAVRIRRLPFP